MIYRATNKPPLSSLVCTWLSSSSLIAAFCGFLKSSFKWRSYQSLSVMDAALVAKPFPFLSAKQMPGASQGLLLNRCNFLMTNNIPTACSRYRFIRPVVSSI